MTYCVGLTGNIATGKSLVASFFKDLGVEIINADHLAKALTQPGLPAYQQIVARFGPAVVLSDNHLDRRQLRDIIFSQPEEKRWLEALLHPCIREAIADEIQHCQSPYSMIEIPLLTDTTDYPYLNSVLLLTTTMEKQMERIVQRDSCSKEQALAIMAAQPDRRRQRADNVLVNDSDYDALRQQVKNLHAYYLQQALNYDKMRG